MIEDISVIEQSAIRVKNKKEKIIYFDPYKLGENFKNDADYIFITHPHFDHFSPEDIIKIKKDKTKIIIPVELEFKAKDIGFLNENIILVTSNKSYIVDELKFITIPAYNINKDFHKKEFNWVGYIVDIDDKKIYVAGDTDNIEEAKNIVCDIAFVPIGGTYTMTYEEAAELIKSIKPKLAVPIHYKTIVGTIEDAYKFKELLKDYVNVEILLK